MNQKLQLPTDPLQQARARQQMQEAGIRQFVAETARELFGKVVVYTRYPEEEEMVREADESNRASAKQCLRAARIFTEEALGVRFEEST